MGPAAMARVRAGGSAGPWPWRNPTAGAGAGVARVAAADPVSIQGRRGNGVACGSWGSRIKGATRLEGGTKRGSDDPAAGMPGKGGNGGLPPPQATTRIAILGGRRRSAAAARMAVKNVAAPSAPITTWLGGACVATRPDGGETSWWSVEHRKSVHNAVDQQLPQRLLASRRTGIPTKCNSFWRIYIDLGTSLISPGPRCPGIGSPTVLSGTGRTRRPPPAPPSPASGRPRRPA